jgi:hypothetical protein
MPAEDHIMFEIKNENGTWVARSWGVEYFRSKSLEAIYSQIREFQFGNFWPVVK